MLAAVTGAVDYLSVAIAPTPGAADDDWLGCAELIGDPQLLGTALAATQFGTDDDAVRASLFCQGYAFRVASVVLGPYALGLRTPDVAPDNVLVRNGAFGIGSVAVRSAEVETRSPAAIADGLLDGHLADLIDALRAQVTVGERLLWGNVASACARVLRAVEGAPGVDRSTVRQRGAAFVEATGTRAALGSFVTTHAEWRWQRASCCLWYRCDGGDYCDDCSMPADQHPGQSAR